MALGDWYLEVQAIPLEGASVLSEVMSAATESGVYDLFREWLRKRTGHGYRVLHVWVKQDNHG